MGFAWISFPILKFLSKALIDIWRRRAVYMWAFKKKTRNRIEKKPLRKLITKPQSFESTKNCSNVRVLNQLTHVNSDQLQP
jgi:hypothetical protein